MPKNEYFVFINFQNPFIKHNLQITGQILSTAYASVLNDSNLAEMYLQGTINYLPFVINEKRSINFLSFSQHNAITNYRIEYDAEMRRFLSFPQLPSRLSAVYAFATKEDCRKVNRIYSWDLNSVRRFILDRDEFTKVARVNMQIISLMRSTYPFGSFSDKEIEHIWTHYWSGAGNLEIESPTVQPSANIHPKINSGEIWEYLIEGRLQLQGDLHTPISF
jgi:hypothetical protein